MDASSSSSSPFVGSCSSLRHSKAFPRSVPRSSVAILCLHPAIPLVSLFWDLDNKPPKFSPYFAALHLRHVASQFGNVVDMVAYANRHAFLHTPNWVLKAKQESLSLDDLDRSWFVKPDHAHVCGLCGWAGETKLGLKRHFKLLHERERQKRTYRLHSLRQNKKLRFRQSFPSENQRRKEATHPVAVPKLGYGLDSELRRAGVSVRTVDHKPQAADRALKRQIVNSMNKGVQCICLVSDDSGFSEILKKARAKSLLTIVIGDTKCLRQCADVWYPWDEVAQGLLHGNVGNDSVDADGAAPYLLSLRDHKRSLTNSVEEYAYTPSVMDPFSIVEVPDLSEEGEDIHGIPENVMPSDHDDMGDWEFEVD